MRVTSISAAKQRAVRVLALAGVGATLAVSAVPAQACKPVSHPSPSQSHGQSAYHVPVAHATGHKVG